jgi:hypothetical protein
VSIIRAALCGVSLGAELFGSGGAVRQSAAADRVNGAVKCNGPIEMPLRISLDRLRFDPAFKLACVRLPRYWPGPMLAADHLALGQRNFFQK